MLAICEHESGGFTTSSNWVDSHETCNGSHGLMNVGCIHGYTVEQLYDPAFNIKVSYEIFQRQGFDAWYTSFYIKMHGKLVYDDTL